MRRARSLCRSLILMGGRDGNVWPVGRVYCKPTMSIGCDNVKTSGVEWESDFSCARGPSFFRL